MLCFVFRGKNWKLASEKKWVEEEIELSPEDKLVGTKVFEEEVGTYEIYEKSDLFYAKLEDNLKGPRWIIAWGQSTCVWHSTEEEAKAFLIERCNLCRVAGSVYSYPPGTHATTTSGLTRVFGYSSPNMPKVR